jgi:hypothetical protein
MNKTTLFNEVKLKHLKTEYFNMSPERLLELNIHSFDEYLGYKAAENLGLQYQIKDSGERIEFETGSLRDTDIDKPRYELIPTEVLRQLAMHYSQGAKKYKERNWEKGQPIDRIAGSMLRHIFSWMSGEDDENHMIAAIWNGFAIVHHEFMISIGKLPRTLVGQLGVLARKFREEEDASNSDPG